MRKDTRKIVTAVGIMGGLAGLIGLGLYLKSRSETGDEVHGEVNAGASGDGAVSPPPPKGGIDISTTPPSSGATQFAPNVPTQNSQYAPYT